MRMPFIIGLVMALPSSSFAADISYTDLTRKLCIETHFDPDNIDAVAKAMNGTELPEKDRLPNTREWNFDDSSPLVNVVYSQIEQDQKAFEECSVSFRKSDPEAAIEGIRQDFKGQILSDDTSGANRYITFQPDLPELKGILIAIAADSRVEETTITIDRQKVQ